MGVKETFKARWPEVTLRFFDWLLALVIFGAIADQGWTTAWGSNGCWFGYKVDTVTGTVKTSDSACRFGIFMGVITWLIEFFLVFFIFLKDLCPALQARTPKAGPMLMFIFKAVWTFFWFATAMNLAIQYTVTCTTMEDLGQKCSARTGHQAQLGALFFSWVLLLFWIITTYWAYLRLHDGRAPSADDSYQQQHDEVDPTSTPGQQTGPEREQPMIGASDAPLGDTSGAVDVTHSGERSSTA